MTGEVQDGSVFIILSYVITAAVIGGLTVTGVIDYRRQQKKLADLEARGIRRRSDAAREN